MFISLINFFFLSGGPSMCGRDVCDLGWSTWCNAVVPPALKIIPSVAALGFFSQMMPILGCLDVDGPFWAACWMFCMAVFQTYCLCAAGGGPWWGGEVAPLLWTCTCFTFTYHIQLFLLSGSCMSPVSPFGLFCCRKCDYSQFKLN